MFDIEGIQVWRKLGIEGIHVRGKLGIEEFHCIFIILLPEEDLENIELKECEEKNGTSDKMKLFAKHSDYGSAAHVDMSGLPNPSDTVECVTGRALAFQRFTALFIIHFKNHLRNKFAHIFQIFLPVALLVAGLVLGKVLPSSYGGGTDVDRPDALGLSPTLYTKMSPSLNVPQTFPYSTIPRLLLRDTVSKLVLFMWFCLCINVY